MPPDEGTTRDEILDLRAQLAAQSAQFDAIDAKLSSAIDSLRELVEGVTDLARALRQE